MVSRREGCFGAGFICLFLLVGRCGRGGAGFFHRRAERGGGNFLACLTALRYSQASAGQNGH